MPCSDFILQSPQANPMWLKLITLRDDARSDELAEVLNELIELGVHLQQMERQIDQRLSALESKRAESCRLHDTAHNFCASGLTNPGGGRIIDSVEPRESKTIGGHMPAFKPIGERVLVRELETEEQEQGGIVIPDQSKEKPQTAEVVSIGTGGTDFAGNAIEWEVKPGDVVYLSRYGGMAVQVDGVEHKVVNQSDILGVFRD